MQPHQVYGQINHHLSALDFECNATLASSARQLGFSGPIVALIDYPNRRAPLQLSGASAQQIGPRITGVQPLGNLLEVVEVRIHDESSLAHKNLAESGVHTEIGVHIVGQWSEVMLTAGSVADEPMHPSMILIGAGNSDAIKHFSEIARPIKAALWRWSGLVKSNSVTESSLATKSLAIANRLCIVCL